MFIFQYHRLQSLSTLLRLLLAVRIPLLGSATFVHWLRGGNVFNEVLCAFTVRHLVRKGFLLQLHVCFWSQFIFLWHLLTFPDLCRVLIQVLLVKNLRGILWKHFSVRARLPNLLSGHNLRIRYVKEMDCSANGVLRKVQRGSCWS